MFTEYGRARWQRISTRHAHLQCQLQEQIDGEDDPPPPPSGPGEGFGASKPGRKRAKGDFRGIKLSNKTHRGRRRSGCFAVPQIQGHPALPSYRGHVLMDNHHEGYAKSINARRGIEIAPIQAF